MFSLNRKPFDDSPSVILQPFSLHPIPRQYLFHFCPETRGVIEFLAMAELVHHHIIPHLLRAEHQQTVEVQVALSGAGSPTALLRTDGDTAIGDANKRGKACHTTGNILFCRFCQLVQLLQGKGRCNRLLPLLDDGKVSLNPCGLGVNKALNIPGGHPQRRSHNDAAIALDLQGNSLSVRTDEFVCVHCLAPI